MRYLYQGRTPIPFQLSQTQSVSLQPGKEVDIDEGVCDPQAFARMRQSRELVPVRKPKAVAKPPATVAAKVEASRPKPKPRPFYAPAAEKSESSVASTPVKRTEEPQVEASAETTEEVVSEVGTQAVQVLPSNDSESPLEVASRKLDEAKAAVSGQTNADGKVGDDSGDGVKQEETPTEPVQRSARPSRIRRRKL